MSDLGRVFITGGSGLVGRHLLPGLTERAERVYCLTRDPERARQLLPAGVDLIKSDPTQPGAWQQTAGTCATVINLAGDPVAEGRWTAAKKQRLRRSRVATTGHLAEAIAAGNEPCTFISASATGFYGDAGDVALTEESAAGHGFLARLAYEWERAALGAASERCRVVMLRIGIVLAREGGALPKMAAPFRLGLGGPLGSGRQYLPWIHVDDLIRIMFFALANEDLQGAINAVVPDPPRQAEFARALGAVLGRPSALSAPAPALRLLLGADKAAMILASQRAVPNRLKACGFRFEHADLHRALADLLC